MITAIGITTHKGSACQAWFFGTSGIVSVSEGDVFVTLPLPPNLTDAYCEGNRIIATDGERSYVYDDGAITPA